MHICVGSCTCTCVNYMWRLEVDFGCCLYHCPPYFSEIGLLDEHRAYCLAMLTAQWAQDLPVSTGQHRGYSCTVPLPDLRVVTDAPSSDGHKVQHPLYPLSNLPRYICYFELICNLKCSIWFKKLKWLDYCHPIHTSKYSSYLLMGNITDGTNNIFYVNF